MVYPDRQPRPPSDKVVMLGGTFDPIHNGHVMSALETRRALGAARVYLLPSHIPPHGKTPVASAAHRLNMLNALAAAVPDLAIDERELRRDTPSYTIDSLREIRAERGTGACLVWIIGWDSLQGLDTWHCWREIFDYANIAVVRRPGYFELDNPELTQWLAPRWVEAAELPSYPHGKICLVAAPEMDLASTSLRRRIAAGESVATDLPGPVWNYICEHRLYGISQ